MHICDNVGVQLRYELFGDKAHPLIVLIAGAGAPAEYWPAILCEALSLRGYHVARFWHRDTGLSTHLDEPYPIDALVGDVLALMDKIGAERAHLAGHSMGGYIAQLIATRHSDRVLSAVAMASGPLASEEGKARLGLSSPDDSLWPKLMANQPQGNFERDLPGWLDSWRVLHGELEVDDDLALPYTRALYDGPASNHQVAVNHVHAMTTVPDQLAEDLADCNVRLLYLHGELDPLVPLDHGAKAATLARNGQFVVLPSAGHMYFNQGTWDRILSEVANHCSGDAARV
uniref:alpha/beta fold hydrolase n=1 Tax=uncultured Altererythrobacter sp. TaxID=500840 RepID=UPI002610DAC9|nr:alpha/beta hydrolase [uncultured Altererythrobacter sp.]